MPFISQNLSLPYIAPAQAQKHVTHNEALRALDAVVHLSLVSKSQTTPPTTPIEGSRYFVAATGTDVWTGQDGLIAAFQDGAWAFYTPQIGWAAWIEDESILQIWAGSVWLTPTPAPSHQNMEHVGIHTTADSTNRLAVSSPATLFNHEGAGHQLKLNKNATGDTASILYQNGFSGRAEIGLTGNDDFHFKVSPDGSTFFEAVTIDKDDGRVDIGALKISGSLGVGIVPTATSKLRVQNTSNIEGIFINSIYGSLSASILKLNALRTASPNYNFLSALSGNFADIEFTLSGDGNGTCDGTWTGGGADYAEYFEWFDGNPDDEDRRGISVTLIGDKIREAKNKDIPIGVISGNPSVVGDAAPFKWIGKYERDDYGTLVFEDYEVVEWVDAHSEVHDNEDLTPNKTLSYGVNELPKGVIIPKGATYSIQKRRKLNPSFIEDKGPYTSREKRSEWGLVGLMGKLPLRNGQLTDPRWIKMKSVSKNITKWLVR